jgi:uncharacterized repeat protein (TIGR03803 family)
MIMDSAGNLYGVTINGGGEGGVHCSENDGCGTVFKLKLNSSGQWLETVIHRFQAGSDGMWPNFLIMGPDGNLYGTTRTGGGLVSSGCASNTGCGVVFELTPASSGPWTETVLYRFSGPDGQMPNSLAFDPSGNLYGTTSGGGGGSTTCASDEYTGCGILFELTPNSSGPWTLTTVHVFLDTLTDATGPMGIIFGPGGVIYGTSASGGSSGHGSVFQFVSGSGGWTLNLLHSFTNGPGDGTFPNGGLIVDSMGNLYGTATEGGTHTGGIVFEISPGSGGVWTENILFNFLLGTDGYQPESGLTFDTAGNLYGTTFYGGGSVNACPYYGCGTVFKLTPSGSGTWMESTAMRFFNTNGEHSQGALVSDTVGNLYGTAVQGGSANLGLVFKLTP